MFGKRGKPGKSGQPGQPVETLKNQVFGYCMKSRALSLTDKTRYSFKGSEIRTNSVLQHEGPSRSKATVTDWRNRWRQKYK